MKSSSRPSYSAENSLCVPICASDSRICCVLKSHGMCIGPSPLSPPEPLFAASVSAATRSRKFISGPSSGTVVPNSPASASAFSASRRAIAGSSPSTSEWNAARLDTSTSTADSWLCDNPSAASPCSAHAETRSPRNPAAANSLPNEGSGRVRSALTRRSMQPRGTRAPACFSTASASSWHSLGATRKIIVPCGHSMRNGRVSKPSPSSTTWR
mmetsp:Transcript_43172/g.129585  ORF Transcript_43172/g.129585 Transcript_43172/m.129585 type:complete len:213 (-) Transcript_43172:627-1265(-)